VERSGALKSPALGTIHTMRPGSARNDAQVDHTVATKLVGSIQLIRSALPHLRSQGAGRIIQISPRGGQVAFPGTRGTTLRRLVSRIVESVAQEVAPFGTGMTIVEPARARTEFRDGRPQVAELMPVHDRRSGAQLPEDSRPGERSGSRRPGQNGRSHHRQRRRGAGAAACPQAPDLARRLFL